jgi:hypothetical protein
VNFAVCALAVAREKVADGAAKAKYIFNHKGTIHRRLCTERKGNTGKFNTETPRLRGTAIVLF